MSVDRLSAVLPLAERGMTKNNPVDVRLVNSTQEYDVVDIDGRSALDLHRRRSARSRPMSNRCARASGSGGRGDPEAVSTASGGDPVGGSRVRGRGDPEAARGSDPIANETSSVQLPLISHLHAASAAVAGEDTHEEIEVGIRRLEDRTPCAELADGLSTTVRNMLAQKPTKMMLLVLEVGGQNS